jgi:dihydrodiol dehydrogenase / D-xylose 1-dehydrogenase (NADP)
VLRSISFTRKYINPMVNETKKNPAQRDALLEPLPLDLHDAAASVETNDASIGGRLDALSYVSQSNSNEATGPVRWGVLGCGRVSNDFVQSCKVISPDVLVISACASSSSEASASAFASKHNINTSYGSYAQLYDDPNIDVIYAGNVHVFRRETGEAILNAGKSVVLEKPFACNAEDATYLLALAKEKGLFIMEGMWTRFFPAIQKVRNVIASGSLGAIRMVTSDFCFDASDSEEYPTSPVYERKLGGGVCFQLGPYPIQAATMCFGSGVRGVDDVMPDKISAIGICDEVCGVDLQTSIAMSFPSNLDNKEGEEPSLTNSNSKKPTLSCAGTANLCFGILGESKEETIIVGTSGRITIHSPCHCPTRITIETKVKGSRGETEKTTYNFPLPAQTEEITTAGGFYYPNSIGFSYEAAAVSRLIKAGKTEAPQYTHAETLVGAKILDAARAQLGIKDVFAD